MNPKQEDSDMAIKAANASTTDKVTDQLHRTVDKVAEHAADAETRLRDGMSSADDQVRERMHDARERSEDLVQTVGQYVRDNPLTAVGIAFVAGSLISSLARRR